MSDLFRCTPSSSTDCLYTSLKRSIWQTHCRRRWTGWWILILLYVCRSMLIWMNSTRCKTTTGSSSTSSLFIRFVFKVRSKRRYSFRSLFTIVSSNGRKSSTLEYLPMLRRERRKCINDHLEWSESGDCLVPYRAVVDVFINRTDGGEHSFHLHSHTFWIFSTSATIQKRNL